MKKLILVGTALAAWASAGAFAQESPKSTKPYNNMTKELTPKQRKQMAAMHEKMAVCLRSTKPMSECQTEMHNQCMKMGKDGCPMMGEMGGMMGHGMMHDED